MSRTRCPRRPRLAPTALALLLLPLLSLSCAYRFAAAGGLPEGVTRVRAPVFINHTAEPGIEALFAQSLREQLAQTGVRADAGAEAELLGEVLGVWGGPTILTTPTPQQPAPVLASYRLFASVRLRLLRGGNTLGAVEVVGSEDFLPGRIGGSGDILVTESNRQAALHRLSERLMREALDRMQPRARARGASSTVTGP